MDVDYRSAPAATVRRRGERIGAWLAAFVAMPWACGNNAAPTDAGRDAFTMSDASEDVPRVDAAVATDAGRCALPVRPALRFTRRVLDPVYRAEGVGAFDVNGDGHPDIVTDQSWYEGPALVPHAIRAPVAYDLMTQFALGFGAYPMDVDRDGCVDVVAPPHPGDPFYWYRNPCASGDGGSSSWTQNLIAPAGQVGLETPFAVDLFGDGQTEVIASDSRTGYGIFGWYERPSDLTQPWPLHPVSDRGFSGAAAFMHGVGAGDVDGDGRLDVLSSYGWFGSTGDRSRWVAHTTPSPFAGSENACSRMWTYDVDCDGLADVLCARPHDHGLYWLAQRRGVGGADPTFVPHLIDDTVDEMHALRLDDLDGDGVPEIVSGTRWCAHCGAGAPLDPSPALVVYYALRRDAAGVAFDRHVVDDASGVGAAFAVADVDGDGRPDIVTANKHGLFFFRQE